MGGKRFARAGSPGTITWRVLRFDTVDVGDGPISLKLRPRQVLLRLLLSPNKSVTIDAIVDFVWGEELPKTASNSVARFVADLRKALGIYRDRIVTANGGYRVVVNPGELDIDRAQAILLEANRLHVADPERCRMNLQVALELAGDEANPALQQLPEGSAFLRAHEELRIDLLDRYTDVAHDAVSTLEDAVARYPYDERFWVKLMQQLEQAGRSVDALRAAQRARGHLADVGMAPTAALVDCEASILAGTGPDQASSSESDERSRRRPERLTESPHGIAEPTTTMIGRLAELTSLEDAIAVHRIVSIVGIGGAGKTRIALRLVKAIEAGGTPVYRVGLASIPDRGLLLSTVASVLGVTPGRAATPEELAAAVAPDTFVLLLDSCEHLLDDCAELASALHNAAPEVRIIATTRQALGLEAEHRFNLGMLPVPPPGIDSAESESVALLIDRARSELEAGGSGQDTIRHLCDVARLVSGHPLALEVAASQLGYLRLEDLALRLRGLFESEHRDEDRPANTLIEVMDWTWDSLPVDQQALLARLAIFGDTWSFEAAEAICPKHDALDHDLNALVERGLITTTRAHGQTRYGMLDPARSYAVERLRDRHELPIMRDRMIEWLKQLAGRWTISQHHVWAEASAALFAEHSNLVAAMDHLDRSGRTAELYVLAIQSSGMWINHGFADEVKRWLLPAVEDETVDNASRSGAAAMVLAASHASGDLANLNGLGMRAIELADGQAHDWIPAVASFLSLWALFSPDTLSSAELFELSVETAERSDTADMNSAVATLYQAHVLFCSRDYAGAAKLFTQVRNDVAQPGRLHHVAEVGQSLALLLSDRETQARDELASWTSNNNTDDWHYMVDIARAIVLAGAGSAGEATSKLAAAVRRLPPARIWGRADEIQTAFGIIALFRDEADLGSELLSAVESRDVLLTVVATELLARSRGTVADEDWLAIAADFWTRVLPDDDDARGSATSSPELLSWWLDGPELAPAG